ncbi:MAG: MCP four helix bundle domain-containing protein [Bacteriovorax sp.]|nr:MCP four helix bundle domain-containing protein [Bacteriovorax sp.]
MIATLMPVLGAFTYYRSLKVAALNEKISDVKLLKTKALGELVFKFRDIRLQIRTVPVRGMSWEKVDTYLENTKKAVTIFLEAKKTYKLQIENNEELKNFQTFDSSSNEFLEFGGKLIALSSAHDQAKIDEVAALVREVCPVKAEKVESAIATLINQQTIEANALVSAAHKAESETKLVIILGSIFGFLLAISLGYIVSRSISRELQKLADQLLNSSKVVTGAAQQVSANGNTLSSSATEQAAALQETVSAIEEISSMISRNSDNASESKQSAVSSLAFAEQGKNLVGELIIEVQEIQKSTIALSDSVEVGNQEMTKIVNVINEIESKTKVINEIVFQTKLLSFNASVEAARAGEAGKGFAVVAEEVGNLAAMSGKAAKEISDLLTSSVQIVQMIVTSSKERVEKQSNESKVRVDNGIKIGKRCSESLVEICEGARKVGDMVTEIATASHEQATGVSEVSRAMNQMDQVTQANATVSSSSAESAEELSEEAKQMKSLVDQLYLTIKGSL